jgi:hypothetical protein
MSANRDELHRLVDELPEEQVAEALLLVHPAPEDEERPWPPAWFGMIDGTPPDFVSRSEEILEEGFGR